MNGGRPAKIGLTRSVGVPRDKLHEQVPTFENSAGTGSPERRVEEQDLDGVEAEVLFSRIQGTLRQIQDDVARHLEDLRDLVQAELRREERQQPQFRARQPNLIVAAKGHRTERSRPVFVELACAHLNPVRLIRFTRPA